jgi:hypothetical protein
MDEKYKNTGHIYDRATEECAEVIQAISKIKRFGKFNYHPDDPKKKPNWKLLLSEIDDCEYRLVELRKHLMDNLTEGT